MNKSGFCLVVRGPPPLLLVVRPLKNTFFMCVFPNKSVKLQLRKQRFYLWQEKENMQVQSYTFVKNGDQRGGDGALR